VINLTVSTCPELQGQLHSQCGGNPSEFKAAESGAISLLCICMAIVEVRVEEAPGEVHPTIPDMTIAAPKYAVLAHHFAWRMPRS
ncbi:hypothetical protein, partial [Pandoraea apista]